MGIAFYSSTNAGMQPQLYCARYPSDDISPVLPIGVLPIENWAETDDYITICTKPLGGLWTSTYTPFIQGHITEYCSAWLKWCAEYEPDWVPDACTLLYPRSDARICTIDCYDDLENLYLRYLWKYDLKERCYLLDWVKISKDYDAVHVTERGYKQGTFAEPSPEYPYANSLKGWVCESTIWFRDVFESVDWVPIKERI